MSYHDPVMKTECLEALGLHPNGIYVDVTFGGGGHSRGILETLDGSGTLFGFDQDPDAEANVPQAQNFVFVAANFRHLKRYLRLNGVRQVDGILADLGVSSHQFDEAERGFSFRFDAELDMRMNQGAGKSAADIINSYGKDELVSILSRFGEVRNAISLADRIISERDLRKIVTTGDLISVIDPMVRGKRNKYLAQVFQALRIEVNQETEVLEDLLKQSLEVLKPGGRMVVISYHSLEDRMVKNFFKSGNVEGEQVKDFYGNIDRPWKIITKKAVEPTSEEIEKNPRARSAKLRIAEKK